MLKVNEMQPKVGKKIEFPPATFLEAKIELHIMIVCMLSALNRQRVCNLEKNCSSKRIYAESSESKAWLELNASAEFSL